MTWAYSGAVSARWRYHTEKLQKNQELWHYLQKFSASPNESEPETRSGGYHGCMCTLMSMGLAVKGAVVARPSTPVAA